MRVGILGGSFDPVHYGHLLLADAAREQLGLNRMLMVLAAKSPLKPKGPVASDQARSEMLRLAIGDAQGIEACEIELSRGGVSYTLDTVRTLASADSSANYFLIVGSDQLPLLSQWHQPTEISALATWAFVSRAGHADADLRLLQPYANREQLAAARQASLQMPRWELSSSDLRDRAAVGKTWRFRTPRAVEEYARFHGLYGFKPRHTTTRG